MENTTNQSNVVTVKEWFITLLITLIPIVGVIMIFVWAFGGNAVKSKENWAKAALLFMIIGMVLYFASSLI
ncbi:MAG: hypothetical protein KGV59_04870 [Tenacibaculum sp.]|nr:hypothetical protein [Tenacibaculum sp.]